MGSTPYKGTDHGIFISRVTAGGPAHLAGLKKDDKVLEINGCTCIGIDHYKAVEILKYAGSTFDMKIIRETPMKLAELYNLTFDESTKMHISVLISMILTSIY